MQYLWSRNKEQIQLALVEKGLITSDFVASLTSTINQSGEDFFQYLIKESIVNEEEIVKVVADVAKIPYVNLMDSGDLNPQTLKMLPREIALEYMAVPLGVENDALVVAMTEAEDIQKVDYLSKILGRTLNVYMASTKGIKNALRQYEIEIKEEDIIQAMGLADKEEKASDTSSFLSPFRRGEAEDVQVLAQESPASQALTNVLQYAATARASDIHIEGLEDGVRVRVRVDGVLSVVAEFPKSLEAALITKVKICAKLKVDEKRLPQDGEFVINVYGNTIDLRVAISPTIWGEQVIMRLLDRTGAVVGMENLGYCGRTLKVVQDSLGNSSGMILTSGPTGSGKTTSLYTLLREVAKDTIKVITLEDPPEYKMSGVNQIQVNKSIGLTFAAGLRSILRQDPDCIMVGEIRDAETAALAVQAALTGHLVFSTLHTNSSAGILPRLLDMGIEPFLISSTIRVVIGQRLIRRNAEPEEEYKSSLGEMQSIQSTLKGVLPTKAQMENEGRNKAIDEEVRKIEERAGYTNLPCIDDKAYALYRGLVDKHNPQGTFKGRIGVYESFPVSETIQELIVKRSTSSVIQAQAQKEGMITMRQDGYLKVLQGLTTTAEVDRVLSSSNI